MDIDTIFEIAESLTYYISHTKEEGVYYFDHQIPYSDRKTSAEI